MEQEEYKSNSYKSKDTSDNGNKKATQITTAVQKKKSSARKFIDVFSGEDAKNVKDYVVEDVLIPALKKLLDDVVSNSVHMYLYGGTPTNKDSKGYSKVSYNSYSSNTRNSYDVRRSIYDFDDVIVDSKGAAEDVFVHMDDIIDRYGKVSIGDLYDLVGITGSYTDNDYGWVNIKSAHTEHLRDGGYLLVFPKVIPLND